MSMSVQGSGSSVGTKAVSDKALENIHTSVLTDSNATKKNKRKQGDKSVKPPPK